MKGIEDAIVELCGLSESTETNANPLRHHEQLNPTSDPSTSELIDLTVDDEDISTRSVPLDTSHEASSSSSTTETTTTVDDPLMIFAEDESRASTAELLACLNVDELKDLARTMKLPSTLMNVNEHLLAVYSWPY